LAATKRIFRLGTRKSLLAMTQSTWVKDLIEGLWPNIRVDLVKITTKGDRILDVPLAKVGGKGLFVKEIEDALLREDVDLAVHSLKDVPTEVPEGLEVSVFPKREDPRDALISRSGLTLDRLPEGARVGTSSLRRMVQLRAKRPDLEILSLRGNLDTRIRKLDEGEFDAILLAVAGLRRLGLQGRITEYLGPDVMLPAIGQGSLAIELRGSDSTLRRILEPVHHEETAVCVAAERAFLACLEGGCQVPIGGYARIMDGVLVLEGLVGSETGAYIIRMRKEGAADQAELLGKALGEEVLAAGGAEILKEVYGTA
jgi:hydroxymethylbilane synthase